MRITLLSLLTLSLILLGACAYRQDIPQGNLLDEEDIEQVKVGMTRSQVRYLLGSPMMDTPFHDNNWLYHYYLDSQRAHRNEQRYLSIRFDSQDRVTDIQRDPENRNSEDS